MKKVYEIVMINYGGCNGEVEVFNGLMYMKIIFLGIYVEGINLE